VPLEEPAVNLHPYVVHFAVAPLITSVVLFLVATAGRSRPWSAGLLTVARWNLWLGAPLALAAIASGFFDYIAARCDADTIAATVVHRRSGAVTWWSSLVAAIAVYRTRHRSPGPRLLAWLVLVGLAATTATVLGTRLTYERGLGVAPAADPAAGLCFEAERAGTA
jgi:uncharacterized membrane protein